MEQQHLLDVQIPQPTPDLLNLNLPFHKILGDVYAC